MLEKSDAKADPTATRLCFKNALGSITLNWVDSQNSNMAVLNLIAIVILRVLEINR